MQDFQSARVLVVGDAMLDHYWSGPTRGVCVEAPVPVLNVENERLILGGAANVAMNIRALGGQVKLATLVGNDSQAKELKMQLDQAGISHDLVTIEGHPTITKLRVLSGHQQLIRADFETPFTLEHAKQLTQAVAEYLEDFDVLVCSDYAKGSLADVQSLIKLGRQAGMVVVVDPKGEDFGCYAGASVITPNLRELHLALGFSHDEAELTQKAQRFLSETHIDAILLTRSADGMTLFNGDQTPVSLSTRVREVFDVTGAGDTVVATFALALAAGHGAADAMCLANNAAAVVVAKRGTATLSMAELQRAMQSTVNPKQGCLTKQECADFIQSTQLRELSLQTVVGGFEVIDTTLLSALQKLKSQGQALLVFLCDDDWMASFLGPGRPVVPAQARAELLAEVRWVDAVCVVSQDECMALARKSDLESMVIGLEPWFLAASLEKGLRGCSVNLHQWASAHESKLLA